MTDLFEEEETAPDLSLFEQPPVEKVSIENEGANKNLAAQGAIINGTDLVGTFTELSLMAPEERQATLSNMVGEAKDKRDVANVNIVSGLIQDPTMTEETKNSYIQALSGANQAPMNSMDLMAQTLHTTVTGSESEDEELLMGELGGVINQGTLLSDKGK